MNDEMPSPELADAVEKSSEIINSVNGYDLSRVVQIINPSTYRFLQTYNSSTSHSHVGENRINGLEVANEDELKLYQTGKDLIKAMRLCLPEKLDGDIKVIGLPESSWSIARSIADEVNTDVIYTNQGRNRDPNLPIIPPQTLEAFPEGQKIFLVDDVVKYGSSIRQTVKFLSQRDDLDITVVAAILDPYESGGVRVPYIAAYAPLEVFVPRR